MTPAPPATFFQRLSAWMFDVSLALWPASLLAWLMVGGQRRALEAMQSAAMTDFHVTTQYIQQLGVLLVTQGAWVIAWTTIIYGVGSILAEGGLRQATWGKRLMGISVEAVRVGADDYKAVALRFGFGALSWLILNIGHAVARWRKDGRALHDLLAGMRVIQEPSPDMDRRIGALVCWGVGVGTSLAMLLIGEVDPVLVHLISQAELPI